MSAFVGPVADGWDGPAVLGDARATGSLLLVDPAPASDPAPPSDPVPGPLGPTAALLRLVGPALLATATGVALRAVRAQPVRNLRVDHRRFGQQLVESRRRRRSRLSAGRSGGQ